MVGQRTVPCPIKGENVIVDTINMKPEHISELMNAVTGSGLDEYVIWWLAK